MLAAQLFQSQHIPYLLRFNSFVSVVEESVLLPPRHSWLRSTCTKRNRMNDMVSETFVSGFDLCTIFLPFHSSNAKKRKRIQKYGICILFLVFLWLFPFFSIYIYIFRYVHLVAMIRIKSDILQKIFRISKNVKQDVYKFCFEMLWIFLLERM